jgi:hypothetical protein
MGRSSTFRCAVQRSALQRKDTAGALTGIRQGPAKTGPTGQPRECDASRSSKGFPVCTEKPGRAQISGGREDKHPCIDILLSRF